MRASRRLAQLAVVAATLSVAGCAVGSAPATPHVSLNISAPTSGATVGVHQVTVLGTVSPVTAAVTVNGRAAHVAGGFYKQTLWVSSQNQQINVVAAAHGYAPANATTTISYSPDVAAQLVAATHTLKPNPASITAHLTSAASSAFDAMFNVSAPGAGGGSGSGGSGSSGSGSSSGGAGGGSTSGGGSNSGGASTTTTPTTPSGGASPGSGNRSSGAPSPPPPPTPAQIAAAIRKSWIHGCIPHAKGQNVVPYCTCTYTQLQHRNILSTRQGLARLHKELKPYLRTGDVTKLPRFLRHAVNRCISKYPPLDPLKGRPTVKPLPGGSEPGQGASNQPVGPGPAGPSTSSTSPTTSTSTTTTTGSTTQTGTTNLGG